MSPPVPVFTDDQKLVLKAIVVDAVNETLDKREEQRKGIPCVLDCPRIEKLDDSLDDVKTTLFGPYDNPGGLVKAINDQANTLKWVMRISGFALGVASSVATFTIAELIIHAVTRN